MSEQFDFNKAVEPLKLWLRFLKPWSDFTLTPHSSFRPMSTEGQTKKRRL